MSTSTRTTISTPKEKSSLVNDDQGDEGSPAAAAAGVTAEDSKNDDTRKTRRLSVHVYRPRFRTRHQIAVDYDKNDVAAAAAAAVANDRDVFAETSMDDDTDTELPTLWGIGIDMSRRQFASWAEYYLAHMTSGGEVRDRDNVGIAMAFTAWDSTMREEESTTHNFLDKILQHVTTQELDWDVEDGEEHELDKCGNYDEKAKRRLEQRETIHRLWKEGKLICEHTNLLSSTRRRRRRCNNDGSSNDSDELPPTVLNNDDDLKVREQEAEEDRRYKLDRFTNVLKSYAERLVSIIEDELRDDVINDSCNPDDNGMSSSPSLSIVSATVKTENKKRTISSGGGLYKFISDEYGYENTRLLMARTLLQKSEKEQMYEFQSFLNWFRSNFPYFHDKCDSCGASCKEDPHNDDAQAAPALVDSVEDVVVGVDSSSNDCGYIPFCSEVGASGGGGDDDDDCDDFSFLGYVYPTPTERLYGHATRTELYRCRSCMSYTRFPRYNKAVSVTDTKRGRCGEYSMLLYRMLRVLGYDAVRWVVDWSDHVWVEVWMGGKSRTESETDGGRWVHLDPCEAAVDNNLLYESWGKNQTYIVAYHDPFYFGDWRGGDGGGGATLSEDSAAPKILTAVVAGADVASPQDAVKTTSSSRKLFDGEKGSMGRRRYPPVEDVTRCYTSDQQIVIDERRGINGTFVAEAIDEVSLSLVDMLQRLMHR